MTAAYHKNANPDNGRVHKVIEELLRIITKTPPENWNEQLPAVEFAMNNAVTTTGYTPFELDTGMHPSDPRTVWLGDLVWHKMAPTAVKRCYRRGKRSKGKLIRSTAKA